MTTEASTYTDRLLEDTAWTVELIEWLGSKFIVLARAAQALETLAKQTGTTETLAHEIAALKGIEKTALNCRNHVSICRD